MELNAGRARSEASRVSAYDTERFERALDRYMKNMGNTERTTKKSEKKGKKEKKVKVEKQEEGAGDQGRERKRAREDTEDREEKGETGQGEEQAEARLGESQEETGETLEDQPREDKREREEDEDVVSQAKRRAWEDTGRGEALPALPSGLDEEDRKRIRTASQDEGDSVGKRSKVAEDIDSMSDKEWEEYKDESWERRHVCMVIPKYGDSKRGKYMDRAIVLASIQNRGGGYYVMEVSHKEDDEHEEERRALDGKRVECGGCILWINSEAIENRMKENGKHTIVQNINDGVREQIKRREWEEECENWIWVRGQ